MKISKLLVALLSTTFLGSCGSNSSLINEDSTIPTSVITTGSDETTGESVVSSVDTTSEEQSNRYTTPGDFVDCFTAGEQFHESTGGLDKLKEALDPEGIVLASVELSKVTIQETIYVDGTKSKELTIGTGSSSGELILNTKVSLKAISFTLQTYAKWVSYSSYDSRDEAPLVDINGQTKMLSVNNEGQNPIEIFKVDFTEPTQKIKISNDTEKHRVFIKSITFIY